MAVDLATRYNSLSTKMADPAVQEAASGLESVNKLIRLLSQSQQPHQQQQFCISDDYNAVANDAVLKFNKVINLLSRARTGHARFRRGPVSVPAAAVPSTSSFFGSQKKEPEDELQDYNGHRYHNNGNLSLGRVYRATPLQQIPPPPPPPLLPKHNRLAMIPRNTNDSTTTINFSQSSTPSSFFSSLTGDSVEDSVKQISSSSAFQSIKPPISSSSSFKRKCSSSDVAGGKCGESSGNCHCSKRRSAYLLQMLCFTLFKIEFLRA